jgi:hypothetical protein
MCDVRAWLSVYARIAIVIGIGLLIWNVLLSRQQEAIANRLRGDPYELDSISRIIPVGVRASCPQGVAVIEYRGSTLAYATPLQVAASFAPRLAAFERIVAELANRYYGRPPDRILHLGARACRSVRGRPDRLSEHALGNALDVSGFEFDARTRESDAAKSKKPPAAAKSKSDKAPPQKETIENSVSDKSRHDAEAAFTVSVLQHWSRASLLDAARHSGFLHELTRRVIAEHVFRGVIGPGHEGHADHLHFDQGPWSYRAF